MKKICLLFILMAFLSGFTQAQKNFIDQPFIEITGSYDTLITPDEIYLKITLNDKDVKNRNSVEEQEKQMIAGLKTMGINTEKDLVVSDILSNFRYYFFKKDIQKTKSFTLKVNSAYTAGKVFLLLENLEISNAMVIRVSHSEMKAIQRKCRANAAENAKLNASMVTVALGQNLGAAINITDVEQPGFVQASNRTAGLDYEFKYKMEDKAQPGFVAEDIEFEKIKVQKSVNVKFVLREK
jgi:uncharacterized protein YggE